ncbi:ComZ family protein [Bacillus badius]|uniref:Repressor of comG operon n=1 Tax=Bacillus badius TaxID=1455 RepID=A0ABR5ASC2_BACBA|nr:ComZ family protein [Bacillus badius]KIL73088.1 putative repressor of comG operon [Bacillus badius]KIL77635.1 putative repressor of comG operon [Bacillus badius]KZO01208.1 competence protein ComG [Bacillus badius]KZR59083.1 competence protein ComG [Bacillus badius]MED0667896.1 ComZ family protein [Bacillus badius]
MNENKNMEFVQIAMKYLPEAQEKLKEAGIDFSVDLIEPFMGLFLNVMNEAYELGKQDAQQENQ